MHDSIQKKTFYIKKQSISFQKMLSKPWATHEMHFWERKVTEHLSVIWPFWLDRKEVRHDTNQSSNKCFSQNTFNLSNLKSHSDT